MHPLRLLGLKWLIFEMFLVVLGLTLLFVRPAFPAWSGRIDSRLGADQWWLVGAVVMLTAAVASPLVSALLGIVSYVVDVPHRSDARRQAANVRSAALIGYVENVLYPGSFLVGLPEFIGLWLVIKTAGEWGIWQRDHVDGRRRFGRTLIGNASNVVIGTVSYGLIRAFGLGPS